MRLIPWIHHCGSEHLFAISESLSLLCCTESKYIVIFNPIKTMNMPIYICMNIEHVHGNGCGHEQEHKREHEHEL
jgi:hypothetical protein